MSSFSHRKDLENARNTLNTKIKDINSMDIMEDTNSFVVNNTRN